MALALILSFSACGKEEKPKEKQKLYVSAATSMTESLGVVAKEFEKENPDIEIVPTFDSSGTLKKQIEAGADCDVFISAAQKQMDGLEEKDLIDKDSRINLLENKCVLVLAPGCKKDIKNWESFETAIKNAKSGEDLKFCMGNEDVPVGRYTMKILKNLGLNEEEMNKKGIITYGSNVKEVTSQIKTDAVDCGIIYATDAYSADLPVVATADSKLTDGPCIYPAAIVKSSKNKKDAKKFLDFLKSEKAMKEFEKVGFTPVK